MSPWSWTQEQGGGVRGARSLPLKPAMWLGMGSPTQVCRENSLRITVFLFAQDSGCSMIVGLEASGGEFGSCGPRMLLYRMGEMTGHSAMCLTPDLNPTDRGQTSQWTQSQATSPSL